MSDSKIKTIKCQSCFAPLETLRAVNGIARCEFCGVTNVLPTEVRKVVAENNHAFTNKLMYALDSGFSKDALKVMVFDLSTKLPPSRERLDWDDLSGKKLLKCLDLVDWCKRRNYLQELVDVALAHNERLDI